MDTDKLHIDEVKKGNTSSFSELVRKHQKMMVRVALRLTRDLELAEDIVQEAFIKAYQKIETFEGRSSFRSWMYQITLNTARNKLRTLKKDKVDVSQVQIAVNALAEKALLNDNINDVIKAEVDELPERQRLAVSLRVFDEMSFKEIAEVMDCPYDTAKANYRHGLLKLRNRFKDNRILNVFKDYEGATLSRVTEVKG